MNTNPIVSFVVPVYNDDKYVESSIKSILNQTYSNIEVLIIDDGSDKKTRELLKNISTVDSRIQLVHQPRNGIAASLNKGIELARGVLIARMDSDDWSYPERIEKQVQFLNEHPDYVAVGSAAEVIDEDGKFVYIDQPYQEWMNIKVQLPQSPFIHPSVVFRKREAMNIGGYPHIPVSQDLFFFNKLAEKGKFHNLKEPLIKYRIHPEGISRKSTKTKKLVMVLLEEYMRMGSLNRNIIDKISKSLEADRLDKKYYYHSFLGRKYLWNNFDRERSKYHFIKAVKISNSIISKFSNSFFYFLTIIGGRYTKSLYSLFKSEV